MLIGIDIDDVMADFISPLIEFHNRRYGTSLKADDFHSYRFSEVWGGTDEEGIRKVFEFCNSRYFAGIKPADGAVEAIGKLSKKFDLVSLTSRPVELEPKTLEWLEKYFPGIFADKIYFAHNSYVNFGNRKKKSEFCRDLNITFLIEDSLEYARECSEIGTRIYLLDKPWNRTGELEGVIRVKSWDEIIGYF